MIGDSHAANVHQTKYLGVIIDRKLNLEAHVKNLRAMNSRASGFLKYSREFLPQTHGVKCIGVPLNPILVLLFCMGLPWGD